MELYFLLFLSISVTAFPQGSPTTPDSCVQLIPRHPQQFFVNNPSAYSLSLSTSYYRFCDNPEFCGKNYVVGK